MKLHEIQSCKCTSQIHIPFSLCWSEDNYVAMATLKGIHVLELSPSALNKKPSMGLKRYILQESSYVPSTMCQIDMDNLFKSLKGPELSNLVMDDTMAPFFRGASLNIVVRQMGWAKFSCWQSHRRSFLTVLTNGGGLSMYSSCDTDWEEVLNISEVWYNKTAQLWTPVPENASPSDLLSILKERSYRLKITAFAWTGSKSTSNLLFTGTLDGTICAWEISLQPESNSLKVELLRGLETEREKITSLSIIQTDEYKCLLIYSLFKGTILALSVTVTDEVEFHQQAEVWDEADGIVVPPGGLMVKMYQGDVILAAAKGPHLLVFLITPDCQLLSHAIWNSADIAITSLNFLHTTELFLTTWSARISVITITVDSEATIKLEAKTVECPAKIEENMAISGSAFSKSKAVVSLACSVKVNFNHLLIRDCSTIVFCSLPEIVNPLEIIKSHTGPLSDIWDALEITRIGFLKKTDKSIDLLNTLIDTEQHDNMDISQLKKNLWLMNNLLTANFTEKKEEKSAYIDLGKEIYNLITAHHIFKRTATILAEPSSVEFNGESLSLMRRWLLYFEANLDTENFPSTEGMLTVILDQLKACPVVHKDELCSICRSGPKEDIISEIKNWQCAEGHELPRCSISLVQCSELPYYVCRSCNVIAHPKVVETEGYTECIYCDGSLHKPRNIGKIESTVE